MMLTLAAIAYGLLAAALYRRLTDSHKIRLSTNQLLARILEFRLFIDEPALIWRAQLAALRANLTLLRLIAAPTAVLALLFAAAWFPLDNSFGHAPLQPGESAVISAPTDTPPNIPGYTLETPGVRIPQTNEVDWRIRRISNTAAPIPTAFELHTARTETWLLWFFGVSTATSIAAAIIRSRHAAH
jgi:hypothetical protein